MKIRTCLTLAIVSWIGLMPPVQAMDGSAQVRLISTEGIAQIEYTPDRAHLFVTLKAVTASRKESGDRVNATREKLLRELKSRGVAETDMMLRSHETRRQYRTGKDQETVFDGFGCEEDFEIVVRDLARLNALTDLVDDWENVQITDLGFQSSKEPEMKRQALVQAAEAARAKAELLAEKTGVKLARLHELREVTSGVDDGQGWSAYNSVVGNSIRGATAEHGVGLKRVTSTVRVSYELE